MSGVPGLVMAITSSGVIECTTPPTLGHKLVHNPEWMVTHGKFNGPSRGEDRQLPFTFLYGRPKHSLALAEHSRKAPPHMGGCHLVFTLGIACHFMINPAPTLRFAAINRPEGSPPGNRRQRRPVVTWSQIAKPDAARGLILWHGVACL